MSGFNQTYNYFYASNSKICVNKFMVILQSVGMVFMNVGTAARKQTRKRKRMACILQLAATEGWLARLPCLSS